MLLSYLSVGYPPILWLFCVLSLAVCFMRGTKTIGPDLTVTLLTYSDWNVASLKTLYSFDKLPTPMEVINGGPHGLTFSWWGCYVLCLRHKPTEFTHSFYSVVVSVSVFMALSTVLYSINSPDNSPLSHSALLVLFLPYWYFQLYVSSWKSPSALI